MSSRNADFYRSPESFFYDLLRKFARGEFLERSGAVPVVLRAAVLAVDTLGGQLECQDPGAKRKVEHVLPGGKKVSFESIVGPDNPRNSVKARILTDGYDQFFGDSKVRVFWPFFPEHVSVPIKPGEHVYVMFEDEMMTHGLWLGKVAGHEGLNYFDGNDSYLDPSSGDLSQLFPDSSGGDRQKDFSSRQSVSESVIEERRLSSLFGV